MRAGPDDVVPAAIRSVTWAATRTRRRGDIYGLPVHSTAQPSQRESGDTSPKPAFLHLVPVSIYTRKGDDGTTRTLRSGRVRKDSAVLVALGDIDEAQAAIGVARAMADGELHITLTDLARTLWVVMAAVAGDESASLGTATTDVERRIDAVMAACAMPTEFVIPGGSRQSAALDLARTVVRRAERSAIAAAASTSVIGYLNRLSDLLWALARLHENPQTARQ